MSVVGAIVVPHPPILLPEVGRGEEEKIQATHRAYERAAALAGELRPDTIVISTPHSIMEMLQISGFLSINFSGNIGVIKTRPGYASSIAYNIDNSNSTNIIGTIAGDDTILIVIKEGVNTQDVINELGNVIPNIRG